MALLVDDEQIVTTTTQPIALGIDADGDIFPNILGLSMRVPKTGAKIFDWNIFTNTAAEASANGRGYTCKLFSLERGARAQLADPITLLPFNTGNPDIYTGATITASGLSDISNLEEGEHVSLEVAARYWITAIGLWVSGATVTITVRWIVKMKD